MSVSLEAGQEVSRHLLRALQKANRTLEAVLGAADELLTLRRHYDEARDHVDRWVEVRLATGVDPVQHFPEEVEAELLKTIDLASRAGELRIAAQALSF